MPTSDGASVGAVASDLTGEQRFAACANDPRVKYGLVSQDICAGADIFFRETFNGNGRTCGSCHPVAHNFTLDGNFVTALHTSKPQDPLFVFEDSRFNLANLEIKDDLLGHGAILENVDDPNFLDPVNRFVERAVNHLFSLSLTITADTGDGVTTNPPVERTGWSGDGAPGDGSLRQFLNGAIKQHYPKSLARVAGTSPGADFRFATDFELDKTLKFQRSLGRLNEVDFNQVNVFDSGAQEGRRAFIDPMRARCNVCHFNGGANFIDTGKNRNFDTRNRLFTGLHFGKQPNGLPILDGGFGGGDLATPNIDVGNFGFLSGFGNGTFNTQPLIEAVDTEPFFHGNVEPNIEGATNFYATQDFLGSPAAAALDARFGAPVVITQSDVFNIGRFLRTLNAAFNLDLAKQRLEAAQTLANKTQNTEPGRTIQIGLMQLADTELNDVLNVVLNATGFPLDPPLYPVPQNRVGLARTEIAAGVASSDWSSRQSHISVALSRINDARNQLGANFNFQMGQGNLMF